MTVLQAVILGIIQGITEFLPVSSSGHLVLLQTVFGINEPGILFDVILHIGTLIPVLIIFWKDIAGLIKKPFQKMSYLLVLATLPTVVAALLFGDQIDVLFSGAQYLAIGFFVTAIVLMYADRASNGHKKVENISYFDALCVGIMQALAVIPGISRSGSTIAGGLFRNFSRESAARFSFLLSIPAIVGATVLQVRNIVTGRVILEELSLLPTIFGFVASMLAGYLSIRFMLEIIKKSKLSWFSYYTIVLGILILVDQFITNIFF